MPRVGEKLSPAQVLKLKTPGMYGDGHGLWLHVGPAAASPECKQKDGKSWIFRFMINGRAHEMGLGALVTIGLSEARQRAQAARQSVLDGVDPLAAKHAKLKQQKHEAAKAVTFQACAAKDIAANRAGWRNAKHGAQWEATLTAYAYPIVGGLSVADIDTGHVTRILEPIWATKPETAARVRGRIESVLDYAGTHRWREGENPARWRGHLEHVLPKRSKVRKVEHHAALPWSEMGVFMAKLVTQEGAGALALRFAILTGGRTGEVIGARWDEIDLKAALWTVPPGRTKADREHRVPLSGAVGGSARGRTPSRWRQSFHLPWWQGRQGTVQYGDADALAAHGPRRPDCTRLSQQLPRLGRGDWPAGRYRRGRLGACCRRQDGGGLPAR